MCTTTKVREEVLRINKSLEFLNKILKECDRKLRIFKEGDYYFTPIHREREETLAKINGLEEKLTKTNRRLNYLNSVKVN